MPGRGNYVRTPKYYPLVLGENIDDGATLNRFGYSATSLPKSSSKKVVCRCSKCRTVLERIRIRIRAPVLCHSCSKSKVDYGDPTVLVDDEQTQLNFGYAVKTLPRYSLNQVVGICTTCGGRYHVRMKSVKPGQKCRSCIRKEWCDTHLQPRKSCGQQHLNDEKTKEQFGYSAATLSPKSFSMVVANCPCGVSYPRIRRNINDTSTCIGCARGKINHKQLQAKRTQTIKENYPEGFNYPTQYGRTATELGKQLSQALGHDLQAEIFLSNGQRMDLFDPITKIGIEYCGLYWHNENSLTPRGRNYHADKMKAAAKDGYRLITVFEDEYKDRPNAIVNRLLVILGHSKTVLQARKCRVEPVDTITAKAFLNEQHVQGSPLVFKYAFGLIHAGALVGLMTGGDHHRQGRPGDLVLSRLCFAPQVHVTGGAKRLFKKFCLRGTQDGYARVVTWSDNRWTLGDVYARFGMALEKELRPDYSYVLQANPSRRFSKQSQKKSNTGCPKGMTESVWMEQRGFSRIWDCGHRRWVYPLPVAPLLS